MSEKSTEEKLWRVFGNVCGWLKYGESKNGVALTLVGLQITLLKVFKIEVDRWLAAGMVSLGLCFLSTLFSFYPEMRISRRWKFCSKDKPSDEDNLLYFGHIKKYSAEEYIEMMEKYLGGAIRGHKNLEDLCVQIVRNSEIASKKYYIFKITAALMIVGQIFLATSVVL